VTCVDVVAVACIEERGGAVTGVDLVAVACIEERGGEELV